MLLIDCLIAGSRCDNLPPHCVTKYSPVVFFCFFKERKIFVQVFFFQKNILLKDYCKIHCFWVDVLACPKKESLNTKYMF